MTLPRTILRFARCESGAFTTDWILQAALVGAICIGVLTSVSETDGYRLGADIRQGEDVGATGFP